MLLRNVGLSPNYTALNPRICILYSHRYENQEPNIYIVFIIINFMNRVSAVGITSWTTEMSEFQSL
jgi:hypothetical protein